MSWTVNTNIVNDTDGYSLDARQVKGTYVVVPTVADRNVIYAATLINGSRCYVSSTGTTYQWNGSSWDEISEDWEFTLEDGSTVTKRIAVIDVET